MGMNLAAAMENFRGITPIPIRLASTSVWYIVNIPSDKIKVLIVWNKDSTNVLRTTILPKGLNPNSIGNFNTTYGFFNMPVTDFSTFSVELSVWVQPTTNNQEAWAAGLSYEPVDNPYGKGYGED